ncbi:hypothetical protein BC941DRAFT_513297 [Chlamydoabsidia padenii]|nr:hypothetical protein BC941DRAFT_513297 [Chlamydoabsidia padenii]
MRLNSHPLSLQQKILYNELNSLLLRSGVLFMGMMARQTNAVHTVLMKKTIRQRYLEVFIRAFLASLPPEEEEEEDLLPGLTSSLRRFGKVHHLGLDKDPVSGYLMGTGYAIINNTVFGDQTSLAPLTEKIEYLETGDLFNVAWENIPAWCRFCHVNGHRTIKCAHYLDVITCHRCHERGHRAAQCPTITPLSPVTPPSTNKVYEFPVTTGSKRIANTQFPSEQVPHTQDSTGNNSQSTTTTGTKGQMHSTRTLISIYVSQLTELNKNQHLRLVFFKLWSTILLRHYSGCDCSALYSWQASNLAHDVIIDHLESLYGHTT